MKGPADNLHAAMLCRPEGCGWFRRGVGACRPTVYKLPSCALQTPGRIPHCSAGNCVSLCNLGRVASSIFSLLKAVVVNHEGLVSCRRHNGAHIY